MSNLNHLRILTWFLNAIATERNTTKILRRLKIKRGNPARVTESLYNEQFLPGDTTSSNSLLDMSRLGHAATSFYGDSIWMYLRRRINQVYKYQQNPLLKNLSQVGEEVTTIHPTILLKQTSLFFQRELSYRKRSNRSWMFPYLKAFVNSTAIHLSNIKEQIGSDSNIDELYDNAYTTLPDDLHYYIGVHINVTKKMIRISLLDTYPMISRNFARDYFYFTSPFHPLGLKNLPPKLLYADQDENITDVESYALIPVAFNDYVKYFHKSVTEDPTQLPAVIIDILLNKISLSENARKALSKLHNVVDEYSVHICQGVMQTWYHPIDYVDGINSIVKDKRVYLKDIMTFDDFKRAVTFYTEVPLNAFNLHIMLGLEWQSALRLQPDQMHTLIVVPTTTPTKINKKILAAKSKLQLTNIQKGVNKTPEGEYYIFDAYHDTLDRTRVYDIITTVWPSMFLFNRFPDARKTIFTGQDEHAIPYPVSTSIISVQPHVTSTYDPGFLHGRLFVPDYKTSMDFIDQANFLTKLGVNYGEKH